MRLLSTPWITVWAWTVVMMGRWSVSAAGETTQSFATMPSHQSAVLGSSVVLPCRVLKRHGLVQWTRDGFGLGTNRDLEGFDRYSMIGDDDEGDFSLRISHVTLEDDAEYQCQVSSSTEEPIRSDTARLTILVPPQMPTVEYPSLAVAGVPLTLTCSSSGGKPIPEIQWLDEAGQEITNGIRYHSELFEDNKRFNASASITFKPTRHHHDRTFTCLTHNPALNTPMAAKVRLNVVYPPEIQFKFYPEQLSEGVEASVKCKVAANPGDVTYRWFIRGEEVAGEVKETLSLGVLSRTDNLTPVACEATNAFGANRKSHSLNVEYAPRFVAEPSSESAEPGKAVTLRCRVDANPQPDITWTRPDTKKVVGRGSDLMVLATTASVGLYMCTAKSTGFSPIQGLLHLRLKGPPRIKGERVVSVREGYPAVLSCRVVSVPHPVAVNWSREGATVVSDDGHIVTEEQLADGVVSTLAINKTSHEDFATYNCSVINEYGMDTHQIILQRRPIVPLMLIVGGGAGVVSVVIVIIFFIICGRRSRDHNAKAAEAKAPVVEEKGIMMNDRVPPPLTGGGSGDGVGMVVARTPNSTTSNTSLTAVKVMPSLMPPADTYSTGQESDAKDPDIRTSSSLSAAERDSDSGWEPESSRASPRDAQIPLNHPHRYSLGSTVFTPPDQSYMSYVDNTRDYSPVPVSAGESYAQFQVGGPYARSTPASDPPSSLPSSVTSSLYMPTTHLNATDLNGGLNGRVNASSNGKLANGHDANGTLKHALLQDLKQELKRELSHDLQSGAFRSKYIIPPQSTVKPGTLV